MSDKAREIKTLIVEDDPRIADELMSRLANSETITVLGVASTVESAIEFFQKELPDLVFLDVELHDKTAFDLLPNIPFSKVKLIFTTAHSKYAVEAFKFSAIDYLVKPYTTEDLSIAIQKTTEQLSLEDQAVQINTLLQNQESKKRLVLKTLQSMHSIHIEDIVRAQSDNNYTTFHLVDSTEILVSKHLKHYEKQLQPYGFFRVHQSHLVNLNCIKNFRTNVNELLLQNDEKIPVARSQKKALKETIAKL